ncbi:MAG: ATP-binding protein [Oscillospiraceae bacterium]
MLNIKSGKVLRPQKVVIYGPEGIGKTTFAAGFPDPVFIDTEGSTYHMDVRRVDKPGSWTELLMVVKRFAASPDVCKTVIIDTADWAEQLCSAEICAKSQKQSIEDFGYGKGYTYLQEEFGKLLNALEDVVNAGMNVVITAHAKMRKFEQPDEMGAYDRWGNEVDQAGGPCGQGMGGYGALRQLQNLCGSRR